MNDNKFAAFFNKYAGVIIGIIIGILILSFSVLKELFNFFLVILICGWLGNFVHKNKAIVKDYLKNLIDKM